MRRHTGSAITIAACLWSVAWASSALGAQTPGGGSPRAASAPAARSVVVVLEDQGVVPPEATRGFTRVCPRRAPHPVGGTFGPGEGSPQAGQFLLAASFPERAKRAWRVVVKNITPLPQPFFAGAVCIGGPERVVYVRTTGVAPPGLDAGADLRCPASAPHGIGGFFRPQQASATGLIVADSSFRTSVGWDVGIRNVGDIPRQSVPPAPQGYRVGAVCAGKDLRTAVVARTRTVPGGAAVDTRLRCPRRTPQPLTGVFAAADAPARGQIVATGGFRTGARGWNTGVRNVSAAPQRGGVGVVCVR